MSRKARWAAAILAAVPAAAQDFTYRGFWDTQSIVYPQVAPNDRGRFVNDTLLRFESAYRPARGMQVHTGLDARIDTHRQAERSLRLDWQDRGLRRPSFSLRRFSASYQFGPVTVEAGKQFIRWGKADILNPTDRFAPRDYINVVTNDFLPVQAVRASVQRGSDSLEAVWTPRFTPSRVPLLNQRWIVLPEELSRFDVEDRGSRFPGRSQFGVRWNRVMPRLEYSVSFFDGFNHLPLIDAQPTALFPRPRVSIQRYYPSMRMAGADVAIPMAWLTLKAEAAHFWSRTPGADEYAQYVIQGERTSGEWLFVFGYAGEAVTRRRSPAAFAPDRGLTGSFLGRAGYTLSPTRSVAFEGALRQDGAGVWLRNEFTQAWGQHWRAIAAVVVIAGRQDDFLGQYRRNSHVTLAFRYSF